MPSKKVLDQSMQELTKCKVLNFSEPKRSYNLQNELRNYVWDKDKDGRYKTLQWMQTTTAFVETLITTINGDISYRRYSIPGLCSYTKWL